MNIPKTIFLILCGLILLLPGTRAVADTPTTPPATSPAVTHPVLIGTPEILVEYNKGTGSKAFTLLNNSDAEMTVALSGLVTFGGARSGARILFAPKANPANPVELLTFKIPKRETVELIATATDVWQPGTLDVDLRNKNLATGGTLKILNAPFNVTLGGADPDKAELALVKNELATISLKNGDAIPYALTWRLRVDGREVCGGNVTLERNAVALLDCRPSVAFSLSRVTDLFKNVATEGHQLLLYPQDPGPNLSAVSPLKTFPVKASLSYVGTFFQQTVSYLAIVVFLVLGGLTSLFLSQSLPNRIKRLNLQDQLDSLARTISDFTSQIDSKLRVLTRVERSRLADLLKSRNSWSPDFSTIVKEAEARIAKLNSRVGMVQQMDVVLARLNKAQRDLPPSKVDAIEACLDRANVLLTKAQPTDEEIAATQQAIAEAGRMVDALNEEDTAFGQQLAQRVTDIKASVTAIAASATFARINGRVPGPLQAVNRIPNGTTTIARGLYTSIDLATEKLALIRDYVDLFDGTADEKAKERLQNREDKFVELLLPQRGISLAAARLLLRQMKDDVYPERLKEALAANEVSIDIDPSFAYDAAPLTFCVCFDSPAVNAAAAREEWNCSWNFGDGLKENGWNVSHYFLLANAKPIKSANQNQNGTNGGWMLSRFSRKPETKPFEVVATFKDAEGRPIVNAASQPLAVTKTVEVTSTVLGNFGERSRTEALKLAAALLIAVFGLVAGAREQLLQLDILPGLIAVFLVGFGADTIKNLLTTKA